MPAGRPASRASAPTEPSADPGYFARAFIEGGALAWPDGFDLSAASLHRRLEKAGEVVHPAA